MLEISSEQGLGLCRSLASLYTKLWYAGVLMDFKLGWQKWSIQIIKLNCKCYACKRMDQDMDPVMYTHSHIPPTPQKFEELVALNEKVNRKSDKMVKINIPFRFI